MLKKEAVGILGIALDDASAAIHSEHLVQLFAHEDYLFHEVQAAFNGVLA